MRIINYSTLLVVLTAAGCAKLQSPGKPTLGTTKVPGGWVAPSQAGTIQDGWISALGDAQLPALISEALANNPDLEASAARLEQALASARAAGAPLYPALDVNGGANRGYRFERGTNEKSRGTPASAGAFGASLDLSWEIDLWGRLRYHKRGAAENAAATQNDYVAARRSLAAQVAKAWFAATEAQLQQKLAESAVATYQETLRIVEVRFRAGSVTQQDVANARADMALARQRYHSAGTTFKEAVRSVEVLLGRYPSAELQVANDLLSVPPPVPAGLPSELLERRPDIVAAERRVAAAFNFTKEANAARLPRLALTSSVGTSSSSLSDLIDPKNAVANFAANLFAPLFDAGLRRAEFEQARAQQREAAANYRGTALRAFQEVENLLVSEGSLAQEEAELSDAVKQYEIAHRVAETRYKAGEIDLTDVLIIQRQELQAKSSLLALRNQRLAQRVNLHLALGGDFQVSNSAQTANR